MSVRNLHPVFRYVATLLGLTAAAGLIVFSALQNIHSVAWLIGLEITTVLLFNAVKTRRLSDFHRSYAIYLLMLNQYFLIVWILHARVPGGAMDSVERQLSSTNRVIGLGSFLLPAAILGFTLEFGQVKSPHLRLLAKLDWIIGWIFGALNAAGYCIIHYRWSEHVWVPTMEGTYPQFFYYTTTTLTAAFAIAVVRMFQGPSRQRRLQLFYYVIGAGPLFLSCWGHFLISLGIDIYPAGGLFFVFHAITIAYATLARKVFDVNIIIRRGLAYAVVSLILGMIYGATIWASTWINSGRSQSTLSTAAFVVIAGLICAPLWNYLQLAIDRLFFRASVVRERLVERLAQESAATVKLDVLAASLLKLLDQAFGPRSLSLYLNDDKGCISLYSEYAGAFRLADWPDGEKLAEPLALLSRNSRKPAAIEARSQQASRPVSISEGGSALLVPILHGGEHLGCLLLEPRKADEPYTDEDHSLVESAAAAISAALLNARAFARLERVQTITSRTLDGLPAVVMVLAQSGQIVQANRMTAQLCQAPAIPATLEAFAHMQPIIGARLRSALEDGIALENHELIVPGDAERHFLLTTSSLGEAQHETLQLVILHEITEYKQLEAMAQRRETLARLGEAISSINHEVKNMIQPIKYQLNFLLEEESEKRSVRRASKVIHERVAALETLTASLQDLSRPIELRIRKVDLGDMLDSIWLDLRDTPMASGVTLSVELKPNARECAADARWLRLVLFNLVKNAVEATAGRAAPAITVTSEVNGDGFQIRVNDNGIGIDAGNRKKLFSLFFSTKGESGAGLGLSICRRIVELHSGSIDADSTPGVGTAFMIQLPLHSRATGAPAPVTSRA